MPDHLGREHDFLRRLAVGKDGVAHALEGEAQHRVNRLCREHHRRLAVREHLQHGLARPLSGRCIAGCEPYQYATVPDGITATGTGGCLLYTGKSDSFVS